jgi:hypothetical protein
MQIPGFQLIRRCTSAFTHYNRTALVFSGSLVPVRLFLMEAWRRDAPLMLTHVS